MARVDEDGVHIVQPLLVALLNAGAGLYLNGKAETFADGVRLAGELTDSGRALAALEKIIEVSNRPEAEA